MQVFEEGSRSKKEGEDNNLIEKDSEKGEGCEQY